MVDAEGKREDKVQEIVEERIYRVRSGMPSCDFMRPSRDFEKDGEPSEGFEWRHDMI